MADAPDAHTPAGGIICPFCDAAAGEMVSLFGSQLLMSQYRCRACGTYFEGLREDRQEDAPFPVPRSPFPVPRSP